MKKVLSSILVSLTVVACHSADVVVHVQGGVHLADQTPSVGMQGDLCFAVATEANDKNQNSVCQPLYTDQNGKYEITLSQNIVRFFMSNLTVKSAWTYLSVNGQSYSSRPRKTLSF